MVDRSFSPSLVLRMCVCLYVWMMNKKWCPLFEENLASCRTADDITLFKPLLIATFSPSIAATFNNCSRLVYLRVYDDNVVVSGVEFLTSWKSN